MTTSELLRGLFVHAGTWSKADELARRARITNPSMGELVRDLEALGFVERILDRPTGAPRCAITHKWRDADAIGVDAIREIENRWSAIVGFDRMAELRSVLEITGAMSSPRKGSSRKRSASGSRRPTPPRDGGAGSST